MRLERDTSHVFIVGLSRTGAHLMKDILRASGYLGFGLESRFMGNSADVLSPDSKGVWRNVFWQRLASKEDPAVFTEHFVHSPRRAQDLYHLALTVHADGRVPGDKTPANLWHVNELLT